MADVSFGTIDTFSSFGTVSIRTCSLGSNRIAITYIKESNGYPYATIYDVDEDGNRTHVITQLLWSEAIWTGGSQRIGSCYLTTDKWVISYRDSSGFVQLRILYYNGSSIVNYGPYEPQHEGVESWQICQDIEENKIILTYRALGSNAVRFYCGTCNDGTSFTWGTQVIKHSGQSTSNYAIAKVTDGKFIFAYRFAPSNTLQAIVGTVPTGLSNRTISMGSEVVLRSKFVQYIDVCCPSNDRSVITYENETDSVGEAVAVTISDTTITSGTQTEFESGETRNTSCCPYGEYRFVVAYVDHGDGGKGKTNVCYVDWASRTITIRSPETFETGSTGGSTDRGLDIILTDDNTFQIAYQDDSDNDYGKIVSGTVAVNIIDPPEEVSCTPGLGKNTIYWTAWEAEVFDNLDNWTYTDKGNGESATIVSGAVRLDIPDGVDGAPSIQSDLEIPPGDFDLQIDMLNINPDSPPDGLVVYFRVMDSVLDNQFYIYYNSADTRSRTLYGINGGALVWGGNVYLDNDPTKLRILRKGSILEAWVYDSSWVFIGACEFGEYADQLTIPRIHIADQSTRGGSVDFDDLVDITTLNLYWKKDKAPNCYFDSTTDLDLFTEYMESGSEVSSFIDNKIRLDIPSGVGNSIAEIYNFPLGTDDFEVTIDISNYLPDDSTNGMITNFRVIEQGNNPNPTNFFNIYFNQSNDSQYTVDCTWKINNVSGNTGSSTISDIPTKLKVARVSTTLYGYYYTTSWVEFGSINFGIYYDQLDVATMFIEDNGGYGGTVDFNDLIITPSVYDSGTKIASIASPAFPKYKYYEHTSLDGGHIYCYEITSEGSESEPSLEAYGLTAPDPPSNVSVIEGYEKNTISWDSVTGADSYNIYWAIDYYPNEYFGDDLSGWTTYKLQGGEYVAIVSNKLKTELYDSVSTGWDLINNTALPSGDFTIEVDMDTYTPSDNDNGHYAYLYIKDSYSGSVDYAYVRYHVTGGGSTHNIRTNLVLNGADDITDTTISGTLTKFKITRTGNTIEVFYYVSSWVSVDSLDFGARASNLDYVQLSGRPNSGNGGIIEFDDVLYWPDLKENGTKITGVTSPYEHTSLTDDVHYYYVVVAENTTDEGNASIQVLGTPFGLPSPPTGISIAQGPGQNTISFTVDPEATETHIYWDTSPGVTTGDTKIADVTSPHVHDDLHPSPTYYYILTSENVYGEGPPSSEYNNSPYPETPTGVGATPGVEKNIIIWTSVTGADSYNIYWKNSSGVTKANGTKITGTTSPYAHIGLPPYQRVYYVVTSEDENGESDISSEVSAIPTPIEGLGIPQEPIDQYSILSTFSDNSKDNLSKLTYPMIGTPPISGYNKLAGDLYDLYEDIDLNSCLTDNSFDIEEVNSTSIKVTTGRCIIGGVCIDIKEDKILNIDDENSYFDWVDVITGAGTIYILIYYDYTYEAGVDEKQAYVGLMEKTDYETLTTEAKEYYCLLGAIKVNSSVEIISPLYYWDPDDTSQDRPHPRGFADGGWLDLPGEFII